MKYCAACLFELSRESFSKKQWQMSMCKRRCWNCIEIHAVVVNRPDIAIACNNVDSAEAFVTAHALNMKEDLDARGLYDAKKACRKAGLFLAKAEGELKKLRRIAGADNIPVLRDIGRAVVARDMDLAHLGVFQGVEDPR